MSCNFKKIKKSAKCTVAYANADYALTQRRRYVAGSHLLTQASSLPPAHLVFGPFWVFPPEATVDNIT